MFYVDDFVYISSLESRFHGAYGIVIGIGEECILVQIKHGENPMAFYPDQLRHVNP